MTKDYSSQRRTDGNKTRSSYSANVDGKPYQLGSAQEPFLDTVAAREREGESDLERRARQLGITITSTTSIKIKTKS